jgi:PPOX class probable F420-dependent enzyme
VTRDEAITRLAAARIGRMATVRGDGTPHVVPFVFALVAADPDVTRLYWAVDQKAKRSKALRRIENLRSNSAVEVLVDEYDEEWTRLWWVRLRGEGRVVTSAEEREMALGELRSKYEQYREAEPDGDIVAIDVHDIIWWPQ